MSIQGKVLVTVTDHLANCPDIHLVMLTCSATEDGADAFQETLAAHLDLDIKGILSKRQRALPEGSTIRLAMTCSVGWSRDYWGECDSDMHIHRLVTLGEQLPTRKMRKRWALWEKQQARKAK